MNGSRIAFGTCIQVDGERVIINVTESALEAMGADTSDDTSLIGVVSANMRDIADYAEGRFRQAKVRCLIFTGEQARAGQGHPRPLSLA